MISFDIDYLSYMLKCMFHWILYLVQLQWVRTWNRSWNQGYAILSQNGIKQDGTGSDSNDDDLDELNSYDGFGGDIELDRSTNVDDNIQLELVGVTNQTAV